jgi:hypothetical protein
MELARVVLSELAVFSRLTSLQPINNYRTNAIVLRIGKKESHYFCTFFANALRQHCYSRCDILKTRRMIVMPGSPYNLARRRNYISLLALILIVTGTIASDWVYEWNRLDVDGPSPRHSHAMVYDSARNEIVLFGGLDGNTRDSMLYGDTWAWNGTEWNKLADTGPSPRMGHTMIYDSKRDVIVLFGGNDGSFMNDTWEWDGTEWSLVSENGPSPRSRHAMAYDVNREVVVIFGGIPREPDDTWEWDGNEWSRVGDCGPIGRSRASMTFDIARDVVTLFGGRLHDGKALGDTWTWNGVEWTEVANDPPYSRSRHQMVYDSTRDVIVAHGVAFNGRNEMLEWDGTRWIKIDIIVPPRRVYYAMAYHERLEVVLLFGGWDGSAPLADTWECIIR